MLSDEGGNELRRGHIESWIPGACPGGGHPGPPPLVDLGGIAFLNDDVDACGGVRIESRGRSGDVKM